MRQKAFKLTHPGRQTLSRFLLFAQDPASDNLGTTIWDASVILVRYMEGNPHLYSRRKLQGKRVLELGAGCGLAGMYFALQGAHVTFTDLVRVSSSPSTPFEHFGLTRTSVVSSRL